jgi:protein TonB
MRIWLVSGLILLSATSFAQSKLKKTVAKSDTSIYTTVDTIPEFPGGLERFGAYLSKTQIPPFDTTENTPFGRVIIQMITEKDGSLTHVKVIRGGNKALGQAYVEHIRRSPKWKPGFLHGKPVRVMYSVPISVNFAFDE